MKPINPAEFIEFLNQVVCGSVSVNLGNGYYCEVVINRDHKGVWFIESSRVMARFSGVQIYI